MLPKIRKRAVAGNVCRHPAFVLEEYMAAGHVILGNCPTAPKPARGRRGNSQQVSSVVCGRRPSMADSLRNTGIALFVLAAFLTGVTVEELHHHSLSAASCAGPSLLNHACGDREKHIPLDHLQLCSLCQHTSQRAALLPSTEAFLSPVLAVMPARLCAADTPAQPHIHSSGKRGPPAA